MKWTLKLCQIFGIDVRIHLTFVLLISWVAFIYWQQGQNLAAALWGVLFISTIFLCVVMHEFGHALAARRYGIQTRDIILLPIGGVARLESLPTNPLHELWVALAGPVVNVAIASFLFVWLKLSATFEPVQALTFLTGPFLERVMVVNIFIVMFNLIPAFPMDGGRILRALLAIWTDYSRATRVATSIGQGLAVFFVVIGLFYNPLLLVIGFFVWVGAAQEGRLAKMQSAVAGIPVEQAMLTDFKTLHKNDSLDRAAELTLDGSQKDFPVIDDGRIVGVLTESNLFKALKARNKYPTVISAMQHDFDTVDSQDMLQNAVAKFKNCNCHMLPVTLNRKIVGLLTMENLTRFMRIRSAFAG